jgi:hypothetical protein
MILSIRICINLTTLVKMWLAYFLTKSISDFYLMAFPV